MAGGSGWLWVYTANCVTGAADIVGQVASVSKAGSIPDLDPTSPFAFAALSATSPATRYLNGQLSRFRESIDISTLPNAASPDLAYGYLRLLTARLSNLNSSAEMLVLTKDLLRNLSSSSRVTPLNHIFVSLVATSLADLSDRLETQIEAHAAMKELTDGIANESIMQKSSDDCGWDTAILGLLQQKKGSIPSHNGPEQPSPQQHLAGLQHLAAAAVGEREGADARPTSSSGNTHATPAPPRFDNDNDIAAAVAAATEAAKAQGQAQDPLVSVQQGSPNIGANVPPYDSSALVKEDGF